MLEIRNVTKVYKTKGGVVTKALDDVSISFGETGLVFLLGKSGSGKSTLLNVSGGLDEPTSGEIIVKGKSSRDFSGSDFDSYRNTFVGFVFQEYNILDEFNVEDNIALALELQGKPKDRQKIAALLDEVELSAYAKRKPNTLSGGQKQRIAIARALIKDPQIIMADEPTGALDSSTGRQVFETLKKLSKTRLVIVVSHDREFAEIYGDRIVELKDGKIISDLSKVQFAPKALDENVSLVGENTISVKSGSALDENSLNVIRDFIANAGGDVIITKGESEISAFRKSARLCEDGSKEGFETTDTQKLDVKKYEKGEAKFIRSRLPALKALKIGASGLKLKPIRLILTILLSVVAFTMFGLFSTMMVYDGERVMTSSFANSDGYDFISLAKYYEIRVKGDDYEYSNAQEVRFTQAEVDEFAQNYGSGVFGFYSTYGRQLGNVQIKQEGAKYYSATIDKFAYAPQGHPMRTLLAGEYPANENEICISSYLLESLKNSTVYALKSDFIADNSKPVAINSASDAVGKYLSINFDNGIAGFRISGVFDSGVIAPKFDALKNNDASVNYDYMLEFEFMQMISEGMHRLVFVSENFYEKYKNFGLGDNNGIRYEDIFSYCENSLTATVKVYDCDDSGAFNQSGEDIRYLSSQVKAYGGDKQPQTLFLGDRINSLTGTQTVLGMNHIEMFWSDIVRQLTEHEKTAGVGDSWDAYFRATAKYTELTENIRAYIEGRIGKETIDDDGNYFYETVILTKEEREERLEKAVETLSLLDAIQYKMTIDDFTVLDCTVVGFYIPRLNDSVEISDYGMFLPQSFIDSYLKVYNNNLPVYSTNYVPEEGEVYSGIYIPYDHTESAISRLINSVGIENKKANDVFYNINATLYDTVNRANEMVYSLTTVFLWVGIVFAVFSSLLMFNFISVSISNKRKEIGILRAVGARGLDVFKIFFSESGIIMGICTLLSVVAAVAVVGVLNTSIKTQLGLEVTLFVFGAASLAMMIGIAVLVAVVSTFLPVFFAARKKPVESIRAL